MSMSLRRTPRAVRRTVLAGVAALALSVPPVALAGPAGAVSGGQTIYGRTSDGSTFRVRVPANWNHTLLLWSHGYRQAGDPVTGAGAGSRAAEDAPSEASAQQLLGLGYALAGSSYARNGWATQEGVRADELLLSYFTTHVAKPARTYVWGASLGGLVTEMFAEKHPDLVQGVAPMCGVLAGTNNNLDLALDFEVAVKELIYPQLKLVGFSSYAEALANFTGAYRTITDALASTDPSAVASMAARVLAASALVDAPRQTQHYDGRTLSSAVGGAVEALATGLYYATVDRYELEHRVGGNPSTNVGVDYTRRISAADLSWFSSFGFSPDLLSSFAGQVDHFAGRVTANSAARARANALGNPSGALRDRTLTLHTEADPLVVVQNESVFQNRVTGHGARSLLAQLYVQPQDPYGPAGAAFGAGHCNFTTTEQVGLIRELNGWVLGARPFGQTWVKYLDAGVQLGYQVAPWPTR